LRDFFAWMSQQPFRDKIVVAGNHDAELEDLTEQEVLRMTRGDVHFLRDEVCCASSGLRIYGSPRSVANSNNSPNCAFQSDAVWRCGPSKGTPIDVLVTHQSPTSYQLREFVTAVRPTLLHACGHVHEDRGLRHIGPENIPSVNGASLMGGVGKEKLQPPIVVDIHASLARR
jgi:hypothetical protein